MGSRQAFSKMVGELTPEQIAAFLKGQDPITQIAKREPAAVITSPIGKKVDTAKYGITPNPGYDDTQVDYGTGSNDLPPERTPEEVAAIAARTNAPTPAPAPAPANTPEEQLTIPPELMGEESSWVNPELRNNLNKYALAMSQANVSPWAALADKWSGGGTHLSDIAKGKSGNTLENQLTREAAKQAAIAERQDKNIRETMSRDFTRTLRQDIKPYQDIKSSFYMLDSSLNKDKVSILDITRALNHIIGLGMGKGTQTEGDISRVWQPTLTNIAAYWKSFFGSKSEIDKNNPQLKGLIEYVNAAKHDWEQTTTDRVGGTVDQYYAKGLDLAKLQEEADAVTGKLYIKNKPETEKATAPEAQNNTGTKKNSILEAARNRLKK